MQPAVEAYLPKGRGTPPSPASSSRPLLVCGAIEAALAWMKGNFEFFSVSGASQLQKALLAVVSSVGALANPKRGGIK